MFKVNNLKGFIVTHKKKLKYVGFGLLLLAIPLTIVLADQQQDLRQRAAYLPTPTIARTSTNESEIASISLDKRSCPAGQFGGGTYRCVSGKAGSFPSGCQTTSTLIQLASGLCSRPQPTPTPYRPRITPTLRPSILPTARPSILPTTRPSLSPTPAKQSYSCQPNSYIAGTYCSSSTSCYDVYCNASGNAIRTTTYSATTCGFCQTYKCSPNSFIAGTYNDGRNFDIYCNSAGNATIKRYF